MNIDFSSLNLPTNEVVVKPGKEYFGLEFSGDFTISKGSFRQDFTYWVRTFNHNIDGYVDTDDKNVSHGHAYIGELEIDYLSKFRTSLKDSGLTSLSDKLIFTDSEINAAMYKVVEAHHMFKSAYKVGTRFFEALTKKEQVYLNLEWVIDTYDERNDHQKKQFHKSEIVPTLADLKDYFRNFEALYK